MQIKLQTTGPESPFLQSICTRNQDGAVQLSNRETYLYWSRKFILFNDRKHSTVMGNHEVERFLNHLASIEASARPPQNRHSAPSSFFTGMCLRGRSKTSATSVESAPANAHGSQPRGSHFYSREFGSRVLADYCTSLWLRSKGQRSSLASAEDIDPKSRNFLMFNGQGRKDRYALIPGNVRASGSTKRVTAHTLRHAVATELLRSGIDIRTVQEILGHSDTRTTEICTHIIGDRRAGTVSPFNRYPGS